MEGLSPHLKIVMMLRMSLESGESLRTGIKFYLETIQDDVSRDLSRWIVFIEKPQQVSGSISEVSLTPTRKLIFELIRRGLQGEMILQTLIQLEDELCELNKIELERFAASLPMKILMPLLIFQFPALLILLFGPLLRQMFQSF